MNRPPYVGFEGPIGVGKTTLARLLASYLDATLVLEDVDGNDFLADFYADEKRWALGMQLSFLISRHKQLKQISSSRSKPVVADYSPAKDGIFAQMLLQDRELSLYKNLSVSLGEGVVQPDVIVYLDARNDILLDRIRGRSRPYEQQIDAIRLDSVRYAYEKWIESTSRQRLISYDTSALNLSCKSELAELYRRIIARASGY